MHELEIPAIVTGSLVVLSYVLVANLTKTFEFCPRASRYAGSMAYFVFFAASIWFPTWGAISYNSASFIYLGLLLAGVYGWPAYATLCLAGIAALESLFESANHPALWVYILPAVYFSTADCVWTGHYHLSSSLTEVTDAPIYIPIAVAYTLYFSIIAVAAMIQGWGYGHIPALSLLIFVLAAHFTFGFVTSMKRGVCLSLSERYSQWVNILADVLLVGAFAATILAFFYSLAFWFAVSTAVVGNMFCVSGRITAQQTREWRMLTDLQ